MPSRRLLITLAALVMAASHTAVAADPPATAPSISFADARARALADNETVRAAREGVTERTEEKSAAAGFYWPKVELHARAGHLNDTIVLDLDPIRQVINQLHRLPDSAIPPFESTFQKQNFWLSDISVTWPLYTGGRVQAANTAAALQIRDADATVRQVEGTVSTDVAKRYFVLRLALRARAVRQEVLNALDTHVAHAQALEREGQIARVERLHAEVARAEAARQLTSTTHDVALARTALASVIAADAPVDPGTGLFLLHDIGTLDAYVARAMEHHPALARIRAQKGRAEQAVRAEKGAWLPSVAAFGMRELHTADLNLVSPTWAVGIGATFTLFDGMERGHRIAAAKSQAARADLLEQRARRDISTLVEQKYRTLVKALDDYTSLDASVELATEMVRVRRRAFDEGMGTSLEVVDAELALQGVRLKRLSAACDFDVALAELLEATGDADRFESLRSRADMDPEK